MFFELETQASKQFAVQTQFNGYNNDIGLTSQYLNNNKPKFETLLFIHVNKIVLETILPIKKKKFKAALYSLNEKNFSVTL